MSTYRVTIKRATTFRNLQQRDLFQDRYDSWVVKSATCSNFAKQICLFVARFFVPKLTSKKFLGCKEAQSDLHSHLFHIKRESTFGGCF